MAAAQATPQAAGDGLVVDSAETSVNIVSGIAAPPADSSTDVVPHTGQFNNYDPILNEQFISTANITWSTSQLPGTLLWSTRIHPDNCNQFIKHISQMYNAWAGSLDFRLKIAGTGFHAGALMVVRLPPNIDPTTLNTLSDVTAFEYALIDPKQLSVMDRTVMDQRNILYHYRNNLDPNDPNSFGGYFAVYVAMQLNTSSTGLNQINVQLWTRAGPDLVFSQLRPITANPSAVGIDLFKLYLPATATCGFSGLKCRIKVQPSSQIVTTIGQSAYKCAFDGTEVSNLDISSFRDMTNVRHSMAILAGTPPTARVETQPVNYENGTAPKWPYHAVAPSELGENVTTFQINNAQNRSVYVGLASGTQSISNQYVAYYSPIVYQGRSWDCDVLGYNSGNANVAESLAPFTRNLVECPADYFPQIIRTFSPPLSESLVLFASLPDEFLHVKRQQTQEMFRAAAQGLFKGVLNPDQAVMFEMRDRATDLPVAYIKAYPDGSLTMRPQTTEVHYTYENYYFVPLYIMQAISPIPTSAEHARNHYIATKTNGDRKLNRTPRQTAVAA